MNLDFTGLHVVVTGGTGSLGAAVVQTLIDSGAVCHIPAHSEPEQGKFPLARHERVRVVPSIDLTDEPAVTRFYASLPSLWASIHTAGAFAMGPLEQTSLA